ncbi:hypothetical protein Bbelb_205740 [Branchiostoma belcheri]|nr:hypothetical protein Bbelb_205740 [Branchiostoma belcheri]
MYFACEVGDVLHGDWWTVCGCLAEKCIKWQQKPARNQSHLRRQTCVELYRQRAKQPRSNTALTTDNIMARGGNDNVPDLPVDEETLGNVFREICGHRYRETFGRLMSADCYGCQVDHPSQRHHPCLFLHDDELREYGHRSLANMLFRKVYADFVGLTVYLCEQEQVPPLESMRQKYEEWRQDMQRSIDADQEKETGEEEKEGGCDNDKSGSVHPWIRDMIERVL